MTRIARESFQRDLGTHYSLHQLQSDALLEGFSHEATDFRSLAAMSVASTAFQCVRAFSRPLLSSFFRSPLTSNATSYLSAFSAEVLSFRASNQAFHPELDSESWHNFRGIASTATDFAFLKGFSHLFRTSHFFTRHGVSAGAMMIGEEARQGIGLSEQSALSFSQRFSKALVTSIALESGGHFTTLATGSRLQALQRNAEMQSHIVSTREALSSIPSLSLNRRSISASASLASALLYGLSAHAEGSHSLGESIKNVALYGVGGLGATLLFGTAAFLTAFRFWPRSTPGTGNFPLPPHPSETHRNDFTDYEIKRVGNFTFYVKNPTGPVRATEVFFNGSFTGPSAVTDLPPFISEAGIRMMVGVWDGFGDFNTAPDFLRGKRLRGRDIGNGWDADAITALREIAKQGRFFLGGYSMGGSFALGALHAIPEIASNMIGFIPIGAPGFTAHAFGKAHSLKGLAIFHLALPLLSVLRGTKMVDRAPSKNCLRADQKNYSIEPKPVSALLAVARVSYRGLLRFERWTDKAQEIPPTFLIDAGKSDQTVTEESAEIVLARFRRKYPHLRMVPEARDNFQIERYYNGDDLRLMILRTHDGHRVFALDEQTRPQVWSLMRNFMEDLLAREEAN